jgi:hypothetical protein
MLFFCTAISNGEMVLSWCLAGPVYVPEEMPEQTIEVTHVENYRS